MRFLLDQPISWLVGEALEAAGHEAVHVRDLSLEKADDDVILSRALADHAVIVTRDSDFGTLLAASRHRAPSVILFRMRDGRPSVQAGVLLRYLPEISEALMEGAVVIGDAAVRIRSLPLP